jgi:peptide/nickel transport system ATP-binding protein
MSNPLLRIRNLNIFFGKKSQRKQVVFDYNLSLDRGEIIGIVGESGSGKSVSAMSIMRLIDNAELEVESMHLYHSKEDFVDLKNAEAKTLQAIRGKRVAYIFQEPMTALHPLFSCGKQLVENIRTHDKLISFSEARLKTIDLFGEMELPNPIQVFDSYPHQLSGGQRQRVMIAMALCNDPELLIADEPTTALDSVLQRQLIKQMVEGCKKRNSGLILISHDVQLIKNFTQRLIVMYAGKMVETGLTEEIIKSPQNLYTQSLLSCQPSFEKRSFILPTVKELTEENEGEFTAREFQARKLNFQPIDRNEPFIQVKGISKQFEQKGAIIQAVDDVSFDIFKGETLGLVGESGCGKSTLSKILINLINPDSGSVDFLSGRSSSKSFARAVQMIFQDPYSSLNPSMRVGAMLNEVLSVHGIVKGKTPRKDKISELLKEVGLNAEDASRYPHEFSGGQRQRISIARALAVEPDLIICDESVSALDVSIQAQILNLFNELKISRKLTYLFISHDLKVVSYLCDRILVMKSGSILEASDTESLVNSPEAPYTKHLLSHM